MHFQIASSCAWINSQGSEQKALFTPIYTEILYCETCEWLHAKVTFIVSYETP